MMQINEGEITKAIESLGDGNHNMREIENQIVKDRHQQAIEDKISRQKKRTKGK